MDIKESAIIIQFMMMPEDIRNAYYNIAMNNYSDRPAKGNAKRFYTNQVEGKPYGKPTDDFLDAFSDDMQKNYPIVAEWMISQGIDLTKDIVFIEWEW